MTVLFYKYNDKKNIINKRAILQTLTPLTVSSERVAGDQDLENVVLHVTTQQPLSGYNYVYIQDWSRYYFILNIRWLADGVYNITCQEDYLNTWSVKAAAAGYGGICKYSGLGDTNIPDPRITYKPNATINRFDIAREDDSAPYSNALYCLRFYSASPFKTGESPSVYVGTSTGENAVFLSESSLNAFFYNYAQLPEADRVAAGKSIISISYCPLPGYINTNALTVTGIRIESAYTGTPIEIGLTSSSPGMDYARLIYSPLMVNTAITPVVYHAISGTPSAAHVFNPNGRSWELNAVYTLKHPGVDPIDIRPAEYGKKESFPIRYQIGYEPFSDQYIVNLFPEVQNGKYTPVIQKNKLTVPFMVDNSLQQTSLMNITSVLGAARSLAGSASSIVSGALAGNVAGIGGGILDIPGAIINSAMSAERTALAEQIGYSISGINGIAMLFPQGVEGLSGALYQAYHQPVSTFWDHYGKPHGGLASFMALAGTGYAEIELVPLPALDGATYNELENFRVLCSEGVIF